MESKNIKGNVAADAVMACVKFYKKKRKIRYINLCYSWWVMWRDMIFDIEPGIVIPDEGIDFKGMIIRRGTKFMKQKLEVEFADGLN